MLALLAVGAVPVRAVANAIVGRGWLPVDYGSTPGQIAEAIIAEWREEGMEENWRVCFSLPEMCLKP